MHPFLRTLCYFFPLLHGLWGAAQPQESLFKTEIRGTPRVLHYNRSDFQGDTQMWTMTQDAEGVMYFGNNDGTLIFDGSRWQKVALPNNSSVRTLLHSSTGEVYVGGFNEFGLVVRNEWGDYSYQSLTGLLRPEELNLENIWSIHEVDGHIVLRSFTKLVCLKDHKAFTIPTTSFYASAVVDGKLYLANAQGIQQLSLLTLEFREVMPAEAYAHETVITLLPGIGEKELMVVTKQGTARLHDLDDGNTTLFRHFFDQPSNNQILSAIRSKAGNYYFGTLSSQIIMLSAQGQLVPNESMMQLQDHTVLNLFESSEGNIWAMLNNGIDCINHSSPVSVMFENASVFDVLIHGGKMYVATNQGVFVSSHLSQSANFSNLEFQKIPGLEGQAWSLQNFQDKVICSHDRGVYIISDKGTQLLPGVSGIWKIIPIREKPNHYLVCTYNGIYLLTFSEAEGFLVRHRIQGFDESSRDIIQGHEEGVFWVCHGYKGVFRFKLDKNAERVVSLEHYRENGLPSPYSINVFAWKGEIIFTTNQGLYTFNAPTNQFELHPGLTQLFGTDLNVRKLLPFGKKTWFVEDDEAGYFEDVPNPVLHKGLFLELKGTFNRGMECIVPVNEDNVLMGTNTGLYAYDLSFKPTQTTYQTLINEVSYRAGSERQKARLQTARLELPQQASELRFVFSAPRLKDQTRVQYSYQLEGLDENWSEWTDSYEKTYTQLYPGRYVFRVRARNMLGEEASAASYTLQVLPVWYRTPFAYLCYGVFTVLALLLSRRLIRRKIGREKEKTRREEMEKQKLLELELHQMRLEREKELIARDKELLEEDVIHKSKELANYTMLLVKKREMITDLREELQGLRELAKSDKVRNALRELVRRLGIHLNDEEHIQVFEANFERVHHEFFAQLKAEFPDLTAKELRLCALVKMNLSNKEIAPILNISVRGVETARYRLRKRLSLGQEDNMVEFLEKLSPNKGVPPEDVEEDNS